MSLDKSTLEALEDVYTKLKAADKPVLVYGTGNGCEKLFCVFERLGIRPQGIFTSNAFAREREFCGFKVMSLDEAERRFDDFYAVLAFGTSLPEVMQGIDELDKRHKILAPELSVADDSYFDKCDFLNDLDNVQRAYSLLSDDRSREVFEGLCCFKITGELKYLRKIFSEPSEVFEDVLKLSENEIYCDLGAYKGDTVCEFLSHTGGRFNEICCFEPDMRNFRACVKNLIHLDRITFVNSAAWDSDTKLFFANNSGRQSAVSDYGRLTSARSLDSFLNGREATYIKYDVEGADRQALIGSRDTIRKYRPKICTAVYHRPYDFYQLPLLINDICGGYRYYLRQFPYYPSWESNLFLVK